MANSKNTRTTAKKRSGKRKAEHNRIIFLAALFTVICVIIVILLVSCDKTETKRSLYSLPDYVEEDYITVNEYSRPKIPLVQVNDIVIHYIGNPGTSAEANRNYFDGLSEQGADGTYASSNFIVGLDGEVIACVPIDEIAYASNSRNSDTISIEVCHPDETGKFNDRSYESLVKLTAWLLKNFELDSDRIIRHYDVTGKLCPLYYVENEDAWEQLKADVKAEYDALSAQESYITTED